MATMLLVGDGVAGGRWSPGHHLLLPLQDSLGCSSLAPASACSVSEQAGSLINA